MMPLANYFVIILVQHKIPIVNVLFSDSFEMTKTSKLNLTRMTFSHMFEINERNLSRHKEVFFKADHLNSNVLFKVRVF